MNEFDRSIGRSHEPPICRPASRGNRHRSVVRYFFVVLSFVSLALVPVFFVLSFFLYRASDSAIIGAGVVPNSWRFFFLYFNDDIHFLRNLPCCWRTPPIDYFFVYGPTDGRFVRAADRVIGLIYYLKTFIETCSTQFQTIRWEPGTKWIHFTTKKKKGTQ